MIGAAKPRSFDSVSAFETLDLMLVRDSVQYRVFLLTDIENATNFARAFFFWRALTHMQLRRHSSGGGYMLMVHQSYICCDPDTIFRSETFAQFLTRHAVVERLSAAQAPFQHGQIERLHRTLRQQAQRVFEAERTCSPFEAAVSVIQTRNDLMVILPNPKPEP